MKPITANEVEKDQRIAAGDSASGTHRGLRGATRRRFLPVTRGWIADAIGVALIATGVGLSENRLMAQEYTITGRIINEATGQGIAGVLVTLSAPTNLTVNNVPDARDGIVPMYTQTVNGLLDLNWGDGAAFPGGPSNNFAVVATTTPATFNGPTQIIYSLASDDGSELWMEYEIGPFQFLPRITHDGLHTFTALQYAFNFLSARAYTNRLQVKYFDADGPARLLLTSATGSRYVSGLWTVRYYNLTNLATTLTAADGSYAFPMTYMFEATVTPTAPIGGKVFGPASTNVALFPGIPKVNFTLLLSPPFFSGATSSSAPEDTPSQTVTFNIGDLQTPAGNLTLTVVSNSNPALAAAPTLGGAGAVRTLTIETPLNVNGRAVVTLALSDDESAVFQDFIFDVTPINDPPTAGAFAGSLRALALDGNVTTPEASSVGGLGLGNASHTIEAWLRPARQLSGRSWPLVLGQSGPGAHYWLLTPAVGDTNKVTLQFGVWSGAQVNGPTLDANTWQHVAATWDAPSKTLFVYVNGVQVGQSTGVDADDSISFTSTMLTLAGPRQAGPGELPFVGAMDELRVWSRALSGDEIRANRNYPLAGNEPQLALY